MRAALIRDVGAMPEVGDAPAPSGDAIDVLAAPINPIDLAVSRGILATGHPELPYVPGCEAVGRTADGRVVWIFGGSLGRTSNGAIAERAAVGDAHAIDVPEGADPALAAALGIAGLAGWLPFAWRAPLRGGENVLVLGATGSVGLVAVQAAKLLGAARVVGMAGTLDSSRFRNALALAAGVTAADVEAVTFGSHGEEMVPVASRARIKGLPLEMFLSPQKIEACIKDAVTGGGQVVALRKTGSATIAPALSTIEVIDHIRGARGGAVPVSVKLEGEYGIRDVVLGVPCHLGASGLLGIDELALTRNELAALQRAAAAIAERLKS